MTTTPPTDSADAATVGAADSSGEALSSLSARGVLDAASAAVRARRLAEVADLEVAAVWAGRNGEPHPTASGVRDPMLIVGGDGTPRVREYALPELAIARDTHPATTRAVVADVLDLQHRLPKTWAVVKTGVCEPWVARKVAVTSRALSLDAVGIVDDAVSAAIGGYPPSAVLELALAKTIAADPDAYAARREAERHRRYVTLGKCDEQGYRHVIARVTAGDAAWVDALVQRVAVILTHTHGHDHNHDELRSMAFGWLARPADLLRLLLDHTHVPDLDTGEKEDPEDDETIVGPDDSGDTSAPASPADGPAGEVEGEGNGQPGGGPYRYRRPRTGWDVDSDDPADDLAEGRGDGLDLDGYWPAEYGGDAGPAGPGPDTRQPPLADQDRLYNADLAARIAEEFTHPTTGEETTAATVSAHLTKAETTKTAKTKKKSKAKAAAKARATAATGRTDDIDRDLAAWDSPPTGPPLDPPDDGDDPPRPADAGEPPVDLDDPTAPEDPTLEGVPEDPDDPRVRARAPGRPVWLPSELARTISRLTALSTRQLAALRGKGTLFVHLTDTAIRHAAATEAAAAGSTGPGPVSTRPRAAYSTTSGGGLDTPARAPRGYSTTVSSDLARTEGDVAPIRVADLADLLGHADVRVVPVRDLNTPRRADAYEHDETTKDHIWLTTGGDVWPYASRGTRDGVDFDHTVPYDPDGPPGQTGTHNAAPLRRRHHRWKTHGDYTYTRDPDNKDGGGGHVWTTPHGLRVTVDHTGTHRITDG